MLEKTDEQLIAQALRGNKSAWLKLVKRYEKAIYHYGIRMTGAPEDALDLMQEVFVSVFRSLSTYNGQGEFRSWLFRIAHFRCVEFYRKKKGYVDIEEVPEMYCDKHNPEKQFFHRENKNQLEKAMLRLSLSQRSVVELKFFEQFTFDEISEQLGISSNTVKSRLYAALDKLKPLVEESHVDA